MNFCVFGAGAWGTAVALHLLRQGHSVTLVSRQIDEAMELASSRENEACLPGYALPMNLQIGCEIKPVLMEADVAVLACPAVELRELCKSIAGCLDSAKALKLVISLKDALGQDLAEEADAVISEWLSGINHSSLSGPSSAQELAQGKAVTVQLSKAQEDPFVASLQAKINGQ